MDPFLGLNQGKIHLIHHPDESVCSDRFKTLVGPPLCLAQYSRMLKCHIQLARSDASRNMARYYELSLEQDLFGEFVVVRRWGRIGSLGHLRRENAPSEIQGLARLLETLRAKRRRGYLPAVHGLN
jgi:predicted DNA-binding WGR domain protein